MESAPRTLWAVLPVPALQTGHLLAALTMLGAWLELLERRKLGGVEVQGFLEVAGECYF